MATSVHPGSCSRQVPLSTLQVRLWDLRQTLQQGVVLERSLETQAILIPTRMHQIADEGP